MCVYARASARSRCYFWLLQCGKKSTKIEKLNSLKAWVEVGATARDMFTVVVYKQCVRTIKQLLVALYASVAHCALCVCVCVCIGIPVVMHFLTNTVTETECCRRAAATDDTQVTNTFWVRVNLIIHYTFRWSRAAPHVCVYLFSAKMV